MNSMFANILASTYGLFGIVITITIIILVFRRIKLKEKETFEKRDY